MYAQNYAKAYRSNSVLTASPGQLVLMLFDGALKALNIARTACDDTSGDPRRFETVHLQISKAQRIIAELQGTLNMEQGGDFAKTMYRLYDYYDRRLNEANMKKQSAPIAEVERLLGDVRNAWAEMLGEKEKTATAPTALHQVA